MFEGLLGQEVKAAFAEPPAAPLVAFDAPKTELRISYGDYAKNPALYEIGRSFYVDGLRKVVITGRQWNSDSIYIYVADIPQLA